MIMEELKDLQVAFFSAPRNAKIKPQYVQEEEEYLELITDGHTLFPGPNGKNTRYERGSLFWHKKGEHTIHRYYPDDPYSCYVFRFSTMNRKRAIPRVTIPVQTEKLISFAAEAFRNYHSGEQKNPAFRAMVYSTLFWYAGGPQKFPGQQYPDSLKAALDFMEQHFGSTLPLEEIASVAGISQPYLFTVFKRYLQTSPHQYLLGLRISHAKQLLAGGDLPIKEISAECGFDSLEVFYRQFQNSTGTTPAAYRKCYAPPMS